MDIYTKRGNLCDKERHKHHSKVYLGYLKQATDQDAKPEVTAIDTGLTSFDTELWEYAPLKQKFFNNKWNGMNLKCLMHASYKPSGLVTMHGNFFKNRDGKYSLAIGGHARKKLNALRLKYHRD